MARNPVFRAALLTAGTLLMSAYAASQPAPAAAPANAPAWANTPLLEKLFQRAANNYQKFDYQGQTVYCRKDDPARLKGWRCVTEDTLRREVETYQRRRNEVAYNRNIGHG
jgi:hypothetical protein